MEKAKSWSSGKASMVRRVRRLLPVEEQGFGGDEGDGGGFGRHVGSPCPGELNF
jgi:hypothetical protein